MFFAGYDEFGYLKMGFGRGCHCEPVKVLFYCVLDGRKGLYLRVFVLKPVACIGIGFDNTGQAAESMQSLDVVFTPAACADNADSLIHKIFLFF